WKERVVRRHPASLQPRHVVPPAAVVVAALAPVLGLSRWGRRILAVGATGYAAVLGAAVAEGRPWRHGASVPVFVAALPVMHASGGARFVESLEQDTFGGARRA